MEAKPAVDWARKGKGTRETSHYIDTGICPKRYRKQRELVTGVEKPLIPIEEWLGKK